MPLTEERPKCLLTAWRGETLLDLQLEALAACGIQDVTVMTGFGASHVDDHLSRRRGRDEALGLAVLTSFNPYFEDADNLFTCWMARSRMRAPFVLLNGDTVFEVAVLERLLVSPPALLTLAVNEKASYDADDMKVSRSGTRLLAVNKTLPFAEVDAESIGLMVFRGRGPELFLNVLSERLHEYDGMRAWYLSAVDRLAKTNQVETAPITGLHWWEVDTREDLEAVRRDLALVSGPAEEAGRPVAAELGSGRGEADLRAEARGPIEGASASA